MALFIFPFMAAVQFICAKIGMVSGKGVAGVIRENYSRKVLFPVIFFLVVANVVNAGVNELILPNYKQTWADIRKISDATPAAARASYKSWNVTL